jgi:hypothetical protein
VCGSDQYFQVHITDPATLAFHVISISPGETLLHAGIRLAHNVGAQANKGERIMKTDRQPAKWRAIAGVLGASVAALCVAGNAHADSRAAQKLGQMGIINQTLQPKPPKSSPGYSAQPNSNANSTYNPNVINSTNGTVHNTAPGAGTANGAANTNR